MGGEILRKMEERDLESVLTIQDNLGFQHWSRNQFLQEIGDDRGSLSLVMENGIIYGYAIFKIMADEAELFSIAVRRESQRSGFGRRLLLQGLEVLQSRRINRVFLEVREGNSAAQSLYRSVAFHPAGLRKRYYPDGENALLMAWFQ